MDKVSEDVVVMRTTGPAAQCAETTVFALNENTDRDTFVGLPPVKPDMCRCAQSGLDTFQTTHAGSLAVAIADQNREFRIHKGCGSCSLGLNVMNSACGQGVRVVDLEEGGIAMSAGLAVGDLIVMVDRISVFEHAAAMRLVDEEKPEITIMTKGHHRQATLDWRGSSAPLNPSLQAHSPNTQAPA